MPAVLYLKPWKAWKEFTHDHDQAVRTPSGDKQWPRLLTFFHGPFRHFTCTSLKPQSLVESSDLRPPPIQGYTLKNRHKKHVSFRTLIGSVTDSVTSSWLGGVEGEGTFLGCKRWGIENEPSFLKSCLSQPLPGLWNRSSRSGNNLCWKV